MSGVIHFDKLDPHTLAIYKWEARCADRCFAWKFSKMHLLGMPAVHTEEGKVLGPSEAWGGLPAKKGRGTRSLSSNSLWVEEQGGKGKWNRSSILWTASLSSIHYPSDSAEGGTAQATHTGPRTLLCSVTDWPSAIIAQSGAPAQTIL